MVVMNNTLCPHCERPPVEGGGATRDHSFPDAFGGQGTIVACKDCNSGIGSGVEGKLLGPESPFTLFLQGSGLPHGLLKATHPLGEFMVDLGTGDHTARTSVEVLDTDVDGVKTVKMFGSPEEIARVKAGFEEKYGPPLETLSEQIGSPDSEPEVLNISVSVNMGDLRRLVAKTALCALTYLQGASFIGTELATWLRQVLDAPREWPASVRRSPQADPDGQEAATRTFDTTEIMTKAQTMLAASTAGPIDMTGAAAALLRRTPYGFRDVANGLDSADRTFRPGCSEGHVGADLRYSKAARAHQDFRPCKGSPKWLRSLEHPLSGHGLEMTSEVADLVTRDRAADSLDASPPRPRGWHRSGAGRRASSRP